MNILLTVDFSNSKFNNDYKLSMTLTSCHSVLLVTNVEQLDNAYKSYDILIVGQSSFMFSREKYNSIHIIDAQEEITDTISILNEIN